MTKRFSGMAIAVLSLALAACAEDSAPLAPSHDVETAASANHLYIVVFHEGVDAAQAARDLGLRHGFAARSVWRAVGGFSAFIPPGRLAAIKSDPRVQAVEEDGFVHLIKPIPSNGLCDRNPSHPKCQPPPPPPPTSETTPWGITRVGGPQSGAGKRAWVIDTGVDLDNPDLNVNTGCSVSFVTDRRGRSTSPDDGDGHGTHVAGTIAAIDNDIDVVGVAPGATICSIRVLDNNGSGTFEWVMQGVDYVAANGSSGDAANMSLGANSTSTTIDEAVERAADKGIRFAIAAGNSGEDASNHTPARVEHVNVYTVSAIDQNDCMPSWSNYGNPPVDFAAPGVGVLSLARGGGTTTLSGTSMAAPHVAGILLLGNVGSDGTANCDPDGVPDPIAHF